MYIIFEPNPGDDTLFRIYGHCDTIKDLKKNLTQMAKSSNSTLPGYLVVEQLDFKANIEITIGNETIDAG